MANMTFKANLLPNTNLGYSLGSSNLKWKINGDLYQEFDYISTSKNNEYNVTTYIIKLINDGYNGGWFWCLADEGRGCPTVDSTKGYLIIWQANVVGNGVNLIASLYGSDHFYKGLLWKNSTNLPSWDRILTPAAADDRYVNITGDTMTGLLRFNKPSDGALLENRYNNTNYNLIRNHNNGNISLSASSVGLYLGYENTTTIDFLNGRQNMTGYLFTVGKSSGANGESLIKAVNGAGTIYMYSLTSTTANRGIYGANNGGTGVHIILVNSNNRVVLNGEAKWLYNRGTNVGISDSTWNHGQVGTGGTNTSGGLVWGQRWTLSGLTYTPSGGSATTLSDCGDLVYWLSQSTTSNTLSVNMAIDGMIYALGGFKGNLNGTATNANNLLLNTRMDYGWNGINYFNLSAANLSAAKVNDTPYSSATWTHILRFNHGNSAGYYTDLAIPFNGNTIAYKRIGGGSLMNSNTNGGWIRVLDELNYASFADGRYVTLSTAQTITGAKTFTLPIYFETGGGTTRAILAYSSGALGYGITYKEGSPDVMTLSASGNANNTTGGADLSINALGDGIVSIRGSFLAPSGNIWAGTNGNTAAERQVGVQSGAGQMYMWSHASTTGLRGIWLPAHGTGAAKAVFSVDTNNNVTFNGNLNGNAATATKLSNTPNNTTTFLRGDNTWTNTLANEYISTSSNAFRLVGGSGTTKSVLLRNDGSNFWILCCNATGAGNNWYTPTVGSHPFRIELETGICRTGKIYGAVWNDYAEMRNVPEEIEMGRCVRELGNGRMTLTTERLQRGCKVVSDTFGFNIGETENCKTPIAVSGRALVYIYEGREEASKYIGWPVCSGPNGTVSIMTEEEEEKYPSRIVGTISEIPNYEEWGTGKVKVNGRIWIYVK